MKKTATLLLAALICCLTNGESLPALSLDAMDWDVPNVVPWGWGKNSVFNYTNGGYIYSRNTPFSSEAACEFTVRVNKYYKLLLQSGSQLLMFLARKKISLFREETRKSY